LIQMGIVPPHRPLKNPVAAKEVPHFIDRHKAVIVGRSMARSNFFAGRDISQGSARRCGTRSGDALL
jgi:hypothetical protein